jgi:phenylacetate-CoA ligase
MIPKIETASTAEIKIFQEQKLSELLEYVKVNSPYYKRLFESQNIDIAKIKTLELL